MSSTKTSRSTMTSKKQKKQAVKLKLSSTYEKILNPKEDDAAVLVGHIAFPVRGTPKLHSTQCSAAEFLPIWDGRQHHLIRFRVSDEYQVNDHILVKELNAKGKLTPTGRRIRVVVTHITTLHKIMVMSIQHLHPDGKTFCCALTHPVFARSR